MIPATFYDGPNPTPVLVTHLTHVPRKGDQVHIDGLGWRRVADVAWRIATQGRQAVNIHL